MREEIVTSTQERVLPEIKQEIREEYADIASHVLQDVLRRLDKAMQAFFRRVLNGETPGYPRFQGRDRYDSFTYPDIAGWKLEGNQLHLSKIGTIKVVLHREIEGTIKKEVDQWYVCFSCEVSDAEKFPVSYEDVGIDLGVSHLATLSNGGNDRASEILPTCQEKVRASTSEGVERQEGKS